MYLDKTVDHQYEMAKVLAIKKELENEIVKNKFNASRLILETNYYKYIKTEE